MIRAQLDLLVRDDGFRSSKRSVAFLKYVVEQNAERIGRSDQGTHHRCRGVRKGPQLRHQRRSHRAHRSHGTSQTARHLLCGRKSTAPSCASSWCQAPMFPDSRIRVRPATLSSTPKRKRPKLGLKPTALISSLDRSPWRETRRQPKRLPTGVADLGACCWLLPSHLPSLWDIAGCTKPIPKTCSGGRSSTHRARFLWPSEITPTALPQCPPPMAPAAPSPRFPARIRRRRCLLPIPSPSPAWWARSKPGISRSSFAGQFQLVFRSPRRRRGAYWRLQ